MKIRYIIPVSCIIAVLAFSWLFSSKYDELIPLARFAVGTMIVFWSIGFVYYAKRLLSQLFPELFDRFEINMINGSKYIAYSAYIPTGAVGFIVFIYGEVEIKLPLSGIKNIVTYYGNTRRVETINSFLINMRKNGR